MNALVTGALAYKHAWQLIVTNGGPSCFWTESGCAQSCQSWHCARTATPAVARMQIIVQSRIMICVYGVLMGVIAIILKEIGLDLGWVYLFMGIVIGSGVFPVYCSLVWNKVPAIAAIAGAHSPAAARSLAVSLPQERKN